VFGSTQKNLIALSVAISCFIHLACILFSCTAGDSQGNSGRAETRTTKIRPSAPRQKEQEKGTADRADMPTEELADDLVSVEQRRENNEADAEVNPWGSPFPSDAFLTQLPLPPLEFGAVDSVAETFRLKGAEEKTSESGGRGDGRSPSVTASGEGEEMANVVVIDLEHVAAELLENRFIWITAWPIDSSEPDRYRCYFTWSQQDGLQWQSYRLPAGATAVHWPVKNRLTEEVQRVLQGKYLEWSRWEVRYLVSSRLWRSIGQAKQNHAAAAGIPWSEVLSADVAIRIVGGQPKIEIRRLIMK